MRRDTTGRQKMYTAEERDAYLEQNAAGEQIESSVSEIAPENMDADVPSQEEQSE